MSSKEIEILGISPIGWIHTLGRLPAIPPAVYMFARHERIVPRSTAGIGYFVFMLIGAATVFLVAHEPVSYVIGAATIALLLAGATASAASPASGALAAMPRRSSSA